MKQAKVFSAFALLISLGVFLSPSSSWTAQPTWFPVNSCRTAWRARDLAKYDFKRDSVLSRDGNRGYVNYLERLAADGVDRKSCYKDWTILVYMAGDNDLHPYALWDVDEMEGRFESGRYAGSTLKSDLVVQLDTAGPDGLRRLHVFQRDDRAYKAAASKEDYRAKSASEIASPLAQFIPENAATKKVGAQERFEEFLKWGVREYPAEKYMVIVWGHGQGWSAGPVDTVESRVSSTNLASAIDTIRDLPQPPQGRFGGIMANPTSGESLSVPALRDALQNVVRKTLSGRPFDVYASDACLMQMAEVAHEIAPTTRYIVGSAQVQSYVGLPYRRLMYELNTGRFLSVAASTGKTDEALLIAKMLPILAEQSLDPVHGQQGRTDPEARKTFTMSALSSDALQRALAPALRTFSASLERYLDEDFFRATDLAFAMKNAPSFMGGGRELGSFISLVEIARQSEDARAGRETAASKSLASAIRATRDALDYTVIERRFGTDYQAKDQALHLLGYRGLGIWIPGSAREFKERAPDFALSTLEKGTSWQAWLRPALGVRP